MFLIFYFFLVLSHIFLFPSHLPSIFFKPNKPYTTMLPLPNHQHKKGKNSILGINEETCVSPLLSNEDKKIVSVN